MPVAHPAATAAAVKETVLDVVGPGNSTGDVDSQDQLVDLGVESLNILEILVRIERRLQIEFNDADVVTWSFTSVASLIALVDHHVHT